MSSQEDFEKEYEANLQKSFEDEYLSEKSTWLERFGTGMADPIYGGGQLLEKVIAPGANGNNWITRFNQNLHNLTGGVLGREMSTDDFLRQREAEYQKRLPTDEGFDEARMLGNVTTAIVGTKGIPGNIGTFGGAARLGATEGAVMGLTKPVTKDDYWRQKAEDVATETAMGTAGGVVAKGVGSILAPAASRDPNIREMLDEGVEMTPGQAAGDFLNRAEQELTSVPLAGKGIENARMRAQDDFNLATFNKVVDGLPENVTSIDRVGVAEAQDIVSRAYDDAMQAAPSWNLDQQASDEITQLYTLVDEGLPVDEKNIFMNFYRKNVAPAFSEAGGITSQTYKKIDSKLAKLTKEMTPESGKAALAELRDILATAAARFSPEFGEKMAKANRAYAKLVVVEDAVNRSVMDGKFTPGQLLMSSKKHDKSVRKRSFAKGNALLQDWATKSQDIIGNTVPNSATTDRALVGGTGAMIGLAEPATATGVLGGLFTGKKLYDSPTATKLMRKAITDRPEIADEVYRNLFDFMPTSAAAGSRGDD